MTPVSIKQALVDVIGLESTLVPSAECDVYPGSEGIGGWHVTEHRLRLCRSAIPLQGKGAFESDLEGPPVVILSCALNQASCAEIPSSSSLFSHSGGMAKRTQPSLELH